MMMIASTTDTQKYMPFSSGTKTSPIDYLRTTTPPLVSSTRNAHSKPCFTRSEKRAMGVMAPEEVEKRIHRIMVRYCNCWCWSFRRSIHGTLLLCETHVLFILNIISAYFSPQRLASDARLCIQDCREYIATEHYNEELHFAKAAVDATGVAYSELLEELAPSPEGVEVLNEVRKLYAPVLESLKQELNKISKPKEEDDD